MSRQNRRSLVLLGQRMFWQCRRPERPGGKTCWPSHNRRRLATDTDLGADVGYFAAGSPAARGAVGKAIGRTATGRADPREAPRRQPTRQHRRPLRQRNVPSTVRRAARPALNRDTKAMDARCCRWNGWTRWYRSSHLAVATAVTLWPEKTHILSATRSSTSRRCGLGLPSISCIPCGTHSARC